MQTREDLGRGRWMLNEQSQCPFTVGHIGPRGEGTCRASVGAEDWLSRVWIWTITNQCVNSDLDTAWLVFCVSLFGV